MGAQTVLSVFFRMVILEEFNVRPLFADLVLLDDSEHFCFESASSTMSNCLLYSQLKSLRKSIIFQENIDHSNLPGRTVVSTEIVWVDVLEKSYEAEKSYPVVQEADTPTVSSLKDPQNEAMISAEMVLLMLRVWVMLWEKVVPTSAVKEQEAEFSRLSVLSQVTTVYQGK